MRRVADVLGISMEEDDIVFGIIARLIVIRNFIARLNMVKLVPSW